MSVERTYYIKNGLLYVEVENDGYTFMRRGAERRTYLVSTVEEAEKECPEKLKYAIVLEND